MRNRSLRLATGTAAGLAALVVGGGAGAAIRPDDRETHGPGAIARAQQQDVVLRPDDRADRRLPSAVPTSQPTTAEAFDWVDAGVGSAATFGAVLLIAGGSVMVLRRGARTA